MTVSEEIPCTLCNIAVLAKKGGRPLEIGATLRKMRKGAGLSQDSLAEKLHMSTSNISRLESNKLKLTLEDAKRWAQETNSMDMLIALMLNVDVASVAHMLSQLTQVATILLGGII